MSWTVTLEIVDCALPSTKLAGVEVLDGSTNSKSLTDVNGQVSYTKDDSLSNFIVKTNLIGYIGKNFSLSKTENGTIKHDCLQPIPDGIDPNDTNAPTGFGGDTDGGCFIVSATTGSSESTEVIRLRQLRDRVATASRLSGQLIDVIYRDYSQFSPEIAAELEQDAVARNAVLWVIVRPLLAWYTLAGILALEQADQKAANQAAQEVLNACPQYLGGSSIIPLLEAIRTGRALPENTSPLLLDFVPRIRQWARLRFASWAFLDPLVRVWRSATDNRDVVDEVAQWLATAPLEALAPPSDPQMLDVELGVLAGFFDFRPMARRQLGKRLTAAWPGAASALERVGFVSQTPANK